MLHDIKINCNSNYNVNVRSKDKVELFKNSIICNVNVTF